MIFLFASSSLTLLSFFKVILFLEDLNEGTFFLLIGRWNGVSLEKIRFSENSSAWTFPLSQILSKSSTSFLSSTPELRLYSSFLSSSTSNGFKYSASKTH